MPGTTNSTSGSHCLKTPQNKHTSKALDYKLQSLGTKAYNSNLCICRKYYIGLLVINQETILLVTMDNIKLTVFISFPKPTNKYNTKLFFERQPRLY